QLLIADLTDLNHRDHYTGFRRLTQLYSPRSKWYNCVVNEIKTFDQTYTSLIERLNKGERAHLELDQELLSEIDQRWQNALATKHATDLNAVLCILDHARHPIAQFEDLFFLTLEGEFSSEQKVFALSTSW